MLAQCHSDGRIAALAVSGKIKFHIPRINAAPAMAALTRRRRVIT